MVATKIWIVTWEGCAADPCQRLFDLYHGGQLQRCVVSQDYRITDQGILHTCSGILEFTTNKDNDSVEFFCNMHADLSAFHATPQRFWRLEPVVVALTTGATSLRIGPLMSRLDAQRAGLEGMDAVLPDHDEGH